MVQRRSKVIVLKSQSRPLVMLRDQFAPMSRPEIVPNQQDQANHQQ
jgi:hypothetical protein